MVLKKIIKNVISKLGYDEFIKNGMFYTEHYRPVVTDEMDVCIDVAYKKKCAIILQGLVVFKNDFTFDTIKLYKRLYPEAVIILSTWESEKDLWDKYKSDIEVIYNKVPQNPGHGSLNLQRETSRNGLLKAIDLGCEYVLKTRTDQRLYGEKNLSYLIGLLKTYPINGSIPAKGRIVALSNGCFQGRLYNVSDMLVFGFAEDVMQYFSYPIDERRNPIIEPGTDMETYSKKRPGEIYIATSYLESLGHTLKWTTEDSLKCIRDYFLIVDSESLDWYWPKYTNLEYRWRKYKKNSLKQLSFKDWIILQGVDL